MSGRSGNFYRSVHAALKAAGFEMVRRNNGSDILGSPMGKTVVVPRHLDDKKIAYRILKDAGLRNG